MIGGPDVPELPDPEPEETEEEIQENQAEAEQRLSAFLRQAEQTGANELRNPSSDTGLNI